MYAKHDRAKMQDMDAYIGIRASANTSALNGISKEVMEFYNKYYMKPVHFEERVKHTKWCILRYPNNSMAQISKMNTDEGVRYIGEFAFGLNPYIEKPIGDVTLANAILDRLFHHSHIQTTFDKDMYKNTLLQDEMTEKIDNYYVSYHKEIEKLLKEKLRYFEKVYLIDLHSFGRNVGCDIVLGNNYGKTTSNDFFEIMKNSLEKCGFIVSSNKPYKGGYITKNYREKFNNCETLQIELYYGTYIDNREFIEEYCNKKINGILFMHIPPWEFLYIIENPQYTNAKR